MGEETEEGGKGGERGGEGGERVEGVGREGREWSPWFLLTSPDMKSWIKRWSSTACDVPYKPWRPESRRRGHSWRVQASVRGKRSTRGHRCRTNSQTEDLSTQVRFIVDTFNAIFR